MLELDTPEARSRFEAVSLVDGRNEPLSRKLLARPGAFERIRHLIGQPEMAVIVPFCMTAAEVGLAEALQLPIYGCDPALGWLGSKTGSRQVVVDEDVRHPIGLDVTGSDDLADAISELDLDAAVSDVPAAIELEDEEIDVEQYLAALDEQGGIVEERIDGEDFRSPSVQLRMSPSGQVDIMSTTATSSTTSRPTTSTPRRTSR